ncbi:uncharacterized protein EI97DRAFT_118323 [Westerdykella ornata]|uniref:Uncharacterized protein n=1 Tax=Westerdykella ornata TaxID=318751 RepID=A0A6A6JX45_WESOR|nr:uncharacterized protein EI97DRAFT_118323 [Westerdykella ornata]KAF2280306.1 hypothetical protein EI97DRAFT_118323 [Westerdykella ornata]
MKKPDFPNYTWTEFPNRERPAEYFRGNSQIPSGWFQNGNRVRVKKKYYHFIWPRDGRNGSKWGRFKDIMTGQGPDIHVTVSAHPNDKMHNRQRREVWANHTNLDDRFQDYMGGTLKVPWAKRDEDERYDFLTRKYRKADPWMMTDAIWKDDWPTKKAPFPFAFRTINGEWLEHRPPARYDIWDDIWDPW